jgi:hypothetical protein
MFLSFEFWKLDFSNSKIIVCKASASNVNRANDSGGWFFEANPLKDADRGRMRIRCLALARSGRTNATDVNQQWNFQPADRGLLVVHDGSERRPKIHRFD